MANYQSWQNRAIFISSTFKDMQAERDVIRTVSRAIEEDLRKQHQHLELVDLRWGLDTSTKAEEEAKELRVLKVCLSEIDRCRPFMIVLLGDRYGWIPNLERVRAVTEEKGHHHEIEGKSITALEIEDKSITALEIEYGILNSPEQRKRSFFYIRKPLPEEEMTDESLSNYFSKHNPAEGDKAQQRLEALKAKIIETMGERVRTYQAKWDPKAQQVVGLEKLAEMIRADIQEELKEEALATEGKITSWQDEEAISQNEFIADRIKTFAGRTKLINSLTTSLLSLKEDQPKLQVYIGDPGSGKSTIYAELIKQLSERKGTTSNHENTNHHNSLTNDYLLLTHACGISQRSGSVATMLRIWIRELSTYLKLPDTLEEKQSLEDIIKLFGNLLHWSAEKTRVILLVDALNQLERTAAARQVQWLPVIWPHNARLLATTLQGSESEALRKRGAHIESLQTLSENEKDDIIQRICDVYHKKIKKQEVLESLKKKQDSPNPLYLSIALQDLMLMDQDDYRNAEKGYTGTAEEKLGNLILDSVKNMPESVEGIYGYILRRAEKDCGKGWVRSVINYLGISRFGLREKDLEALISKDTNEAWDSLRFASLRRMLRVHFIYRGQEGVWDYTHQQFRKNILQELADGEQKQNLHRNLASYLQELSDEDPLKQKEIMYHYYLGDMKKEAALYYVNVPTKEATQKATQILAEQLKEDSGLKDEKTIQWVGQILSVKDLDDDTKIGFCYRLDFDIREEVGIAITPKERILLLELAKKTLNKVIPTEGNSKVLLSEKSVNQTLIGEMYQSEGEKEKALTSYEESLGIWRELTRRYPEEQSFLRGLSSCLGHLGDWYKSEGEKEKARTCYEESLGIDRELSHRYPEELDVLKNLSVSLNRMGSQDSLLNPKAYLRLTVTLIKLGDWYKSEGEKEKARTSYEECLGIDRELSLWYPEDPDIRMSLGTCLNKLGDWYQSEGEIEKARTCYEESVGIERELGLWYPEEPNFRRNLSVILERMGDWYKSEGEKEKARTSYEECLGIRRELSRQYPEEPKFLRDLSVILNRMGDWYKSEGEKEKAHTSYEESLGIDRELSRRYHEEPAFLRDLSISLNKMGIWYQSEGEKEKTRTSYEESIGIGRELSRQYPEEPVFRRGLSVSLEILGYWYQSEREGEKARTSYEESLEIRRELSRRYPEDPDFRRGLSISLSKLGDWYKSEGEKEKALVYYQESLKIALILYNEYPRVKNYFELLGYVRQEKFNLENEIKPFIPTAHRGADSKRASELNIKYQKQKQIYDSLPWWKKIFTKKPEAPKT